MDTIWRPDLTQAEGPKYLALARALRDAIKNGILPQGTQLPTVRDLAYRISVTPGTVSRAYQIATSEGLLEATVGRGTFVAATALRLGPRQSLFPGAEMINTEGQLDLRTPHLPEVGQAEAMAATLRRIALNIGPDWVDYTHQSDEAPLRNCIVDWLRGRVLGGFTAGDVMLTHGGQNSLGLVMSCCLRGERPVVLIEELAYPGFRYAARATRAEVVTLEMDAEGILPEALEAACRRYGPQLLCLTPSAQNPTCAAMGLERMEQIVSIARRYDLHIVEDDCYDYGAMNRPALRALAPERVWYLGSLSKSVSASLRFGYVICPTGMGETARLAAQHQFFALSRVLSEVCLDLLQSGQADAIRSAVRRAFSERSEILVNRLGAFELSWQPGLPFAWLTLPQGWRAYTFTRMAEDAGVLLRAADQYAMINGRAPNAVRIAVAANVPLARFDAGMQQVADLLPRPPSDMAV